MRRRRYGLTGETGPKAIDPASGFEVQLSDLVKAWDGEMIYYRFVDRRNPQDFVRGVKDKQSLPFSRPEPPDTFVATNIFWEDNSVMVLEDGGPIITEGVDPEDTL